TMDTALFPELDPSVAGPGGETARPAQTTPAGGPPAAPQRLGAGNPASSDELARCSPLLNGKASAYRCTDPLERPCPRFRSGGRPVPGDLRFEIAEADPVRALAEVHLRHRHAAPLLG